MVLGLLFLGGLSLALVPPRALARPGLDDHFSQDPSVVIPFDVAQDRRES